MPHCAVIEARMIILLRTPQLFNGPVTHKIAPWRWYFDPF